MIPPETETRLIKIVADQLGIDPDRLEPEARFVDDLGADSLDLIELVMAFEEEFHLTIPATEAAQLLTVGDAFDYVKGRLSAATTS